MASRKLTLGDLVYRLGFENDEQFVRELDKLMQRGEREAEKGGREAGRRWTDEFKATFSGAAIGSFIGSFAAQAFARAVDAARDFAIASVKEFAVYEQGLLQLKLAGEENIGAVEDRIKSLARTSRVFSRTDISLAVGDLVKAGYDVETAMALAETATLGAASEVDAATGKFGDLSQTAKALGNILRALGYDTSQTGRVMDVLAKAAQDSNLDVSDLVEIVSRVGPTAKLAGLEIEDLAAAAAVLSNNGMDASLIATGLRSVLQSLINPSGELADELDALGVSLVDRHGNIRDFNDVLDGLHELTLRGGEGLRILTAATGSYGSATASSLGQASDTVKQFRTDLEDAEGAAQRLADTMRDSGAGAAAEMEARLADARVELGEKLTPVLVDLYESVLPALVEGLERVIGLWNDWYFLIHGTTPEMQRAQEQFERQFGPGELEVLEEIRELRQRRATLEREKADILAGVGMGGPGAVDDDDRLFVAEVLDPEIAAIDEQIREREAYYRSLRQQNQAAKGVPGADPDASENLADANDDLAASNRNLNRSIEERPKDPLIEDAGRIQRDLQRLKLGFDQGNLSMREYVEAVEAHVRRLDGLYAQATDPEQTLAILRARQTALQEIQRVMGDGRPPSDILGVPDAGGLAGQPTRRPESEAELRRMLEEADQRRAEQEAMLARLRRDAAAAAAEWDQRLNDEIAANQRLQQESQGRVQVIKNQARGVYDSVSEALRSGSTGLMREALGQIDEFADRFGEKWATALFGPLRELMEREIAAFEARMARAAALDDAISRDVAAARARQEEVDAERLRRETRASRVQGIVDAAIESGDREQIKTAFEEIERFRRDFGEAWTKVIFEESGKALERAVELLDGEARRLEREYVNQSLARLNLGGPDPNFVRGIDRARGEIVRFTQAQRVLGQATRDDVRAALEDQIATIERLLPKLTEGSDTWWELVYALQAARQALADLNAEVAANVMPDLTDESSVRAAARAVEAEIANIQAQIAAGPDAALLAALEGRLAFLQALLQVLRQAMADFDAKADAEAQAKAIEGQADALAERIVGIAESFPRAIVQGIESGDIGAALQNALGGAADFFLDMMLDAILGPIKEQLAAAIAESLAAKAAGDAVGGAAGAAGGLAALGPAGIALGGLALVASMVIGASRARERQAASSRRDVQRAVSAAPSITYNLNAHVNVSSQADFSDPAFHSRWRAETEALVIALLRKVRTA